MKCAVSGVLCAVWSVKCAVSGVQCGVESVKCEVRCSTGRYLLQAFNIQNTIYLELFCARIVVQSSTGRYFVQAM